MMSRIQEVPSGARVRRFGGSTHKSPSLPLGSQFRNIFKLFQNCLATSGRDCSSVPRAATHKCSGRVRGLARGLGGTEGPELTTTRD
jgi:hypothetical protein